MTSNINKGVFTVQQVEAYRNKFAKDEITIKEICDEKHVSETVVRHMLRGKTYKHAGGYCTKILKGKAKV